MPYIKMNSKWIMDLNVKIELCVTFNRFQYKSKTVKLSEDNIGESVQSRGPGKAY